MAYFEFLQKYINLQSGILLDEVINLGFALVGYSLTDESSYWNNALTNEVLHHNQILEIEKVLLSHNRKSSLYFENTESLNPLVAKLVQENYRKEWSDCFQFWSGKKIDSEYLRNIKRVENPTDLGVFLTTFDMCYRKDDPQNPYGELGAYLTVTEKVWHKHKGTNRIEYFIAYSNNTPVAVSSLTNFGEMGYISNVGSLKEVRGKGYGKAVTLFCVNQSIKNGNTEHCLATEEGHYPYEFYKRIGFIDRFVAVGYTKN